MLRVPDALTERNKIPSIAIDHDGSPLKANRAVLAWTPRWSSRPSCRETRGQIAVGPIVPDWDDTNWALPFACTAGATYVDRRKLHGTESLLRLLRDFIEIVIHSGIDPQAAHRAFLAIEEYREMMEPNR